MSAASLASLPLLDRASAQAMVAHARQLAAQAGLTLREAPPEPSTCCGRGCNGCVWEGYFAAMAYWREEALLLLPADHAGAGLATA